MHLSSLLGALLATSTLLAALPQPDINIHISLSDGSGNGNGNNAVKSFVDQDIIGPPNRMHMIESLGDFRRSIDSEKTVFVEFTAGSCGPCDFTGTAYVGMSGKYSNNEFYRVDIDDQSEVAKEAGIRSLPNFKAYKLGNLIGEVVGADSNALRKMIEEAVARD